MKTTIGLKKERLPENKKKHDAIDAKHTHIVKKHKEAVARGEDVRYVDNI